MKIFLDDERIAPEGWMQARWPSEVISLLQTGNVTHISLDHDLGDDQRGTGYDVLVWIEQEVVVRQFVPPEIVIHTANPAARQRMQAAVDSIHLRGISMPTQPQLPGTYMKHMMTDARDCLIKWDANFGKMIITLYVDFLSPALLVGFLESLHERDDRFAKTEIVGAFHICKRFDVRLELPSTAFEVRAYRPCSMSQTRKEPIELELFEIKEKS